MLPSGQYIIFRVTEDDGSVFEFGVPADKTFIHCVNRDFAAGFIRSAEIIGTYKEVG